MNEKRISPKGTNWDDFQKEIYTPEEIAEANVRVALIGEIIKARQNRGFTQKKLEEISGVKQPVIARMERCTTDPHLSTMIKLLAPLGKTLAVVPLDSDNR